MDGLTETASVVVADYIAQFLADRNVPAVFELSGGMIAFITDAIDRLGVTPIVNVRHEQAAGFAAEGATRATGIPSVALATSGPGATNLITAMGSAYFDSTPLVFITGQVNQAELRANSKQRQNGFQELDIVNMVKGITKYAVRVSNAEELALELNRAWSMSIEGRPGPVLIDIPIDVQQMEIRTFPRISNIQDEDRSDPLAPEKIRLVVEAISGSKYPLILVGGGVRSAGAVAAFRAFAESTTIPVVFSLMGTDALSSNSELRVGLIGSYGNRWANRALAMADVLLVLGSRLDVRQTGSSVAEFKNGKTIIRIDIDEHELSGRVKADIEIKSTLSSFLENNQIRSLKFDSSTFLKLIRKWESEFPSAQEQVAKMDLIPNELMIWISKVFAESNGYIVDVGQHQMWAAQSLRLNPNQRFITSGGMGAMGFSIPASIGAAAAREGKWVAIAGDGCTQLAIAELQTLKQYQSSVILFVINNGQHGMVAQFQEENMDSRFVGTREGYSTPNFVAIAQAFGIPSMKIETTEDLPKAEDFIAKWETGSILIEVAISNEAKALPKLNRNSSLGDL